MGTFFGLFCCLYLCFGFISPSCIFIFLSKHCISQIPDRAMPWSTSDPLQMHLSIQPSLQHGPKHFKLGGSFSFSPSSSSFAVLLLDLLLLLPRLLLFCRRTQRCRSCWGCTAWALLPLLVLFFLICCFFFLFFFFSAGKLSAAEAAEGAQHGAFSFSSSSFSPSSSSS